MLSEERMKTIWFLFKKLRESQYAGEFKEFGYYLEAVIPLARSITHGMQKEFKGKNGFLEWYGNPKNPENSEKGTKIFEMKSCELFDFFNNERNIILKECKSPNRTSRFNVMAFHNGNLDFKPKIIIKKKGQKIEGKLVHPQNIEEEIKSDIKIIHKYYFEKKPNLQALIYVHRYLRKLEDMTLQAKKLFSKDSISI